MTREEAKTEAREFIRLILDACAKSEGFDGYRESDWSVDTEPFVSWLVPRLVEPLDLRLSAIERSLTALGGFLDPDWEKNDLPWRSELVQRAANDLDHPTAVQTNIKGRFFREGMANMLVWLHDHPEVCASLAMKGGFMLKQPRVQE